MKTYHADPADPDAVAKALLDKYRDQNGLNIDIPVQCTRCRNKHMESERVSILADSVTSNLVCPRCGGKNFYDLRPQVAWCWASGLIEFGDEESIPEDSIVIARGPKYSLKGVVSVIARHGYGSGAGQLLVPGIPEAGDQQAAGDALAKWLEWCAKGNGQKNRYGVKFEIEKTT